ncbi:MAG: DNA-binding response regulator [Muribaculaceae bacterium]|nr:DNA-binding response regulator [Roseburia sp.]MCM1431895.1 DNA-binding response regulator [Muribaculaceae bacterium]MCM1493455.1 DNA-binding response regulator [Muribaculaceae bacterium]
MWNIVICEPNKSFTGRFSDQIRKFYESRNFDINIQIYHSGMTLSANVEKPMNLIFLNTRPDGNSDYDLAKRITELHPKARLIFLSDHDEDVFEAINYHPYRYIRKQYWDKELGDALDSLWAAEHQGHFILIKQKRVTTAIPIDDILYLESAGHYVVFHCAGRTYRMRDKLATFEPMLTAQYFIHPAKSYLINCAAIEKFGPTIFLKNGGRISCSKPRYQDTILLYEKYVKEMHPDSQ